MRKTKRRKKISKFTYKKKAGMLRFRSMFMSGLSPTRTITPIFKIKDAFQILDKITSLIVQNDFTNMDNMKGDIFKMTTIVGYLSDSEKIGFVERFNTTFKDNHKKHPVVMELYFTQIITIIDANLSGNLLSPESTRLAKIASLSPEVLLSTKLSHDTMIMIVTKFQTSQSSLSVPLEIAQRSSQSAPTTLLGSRMSGGKRIRI